MPDDMTLNEARAIGYEKLKVSRELFDKCLEVTKKMEVKPKDVPPMTLIMAILGSTEALTKAMGKEADEQELAYLQAEMGDAIELLKMAEREWRMEQVVGRGRA